MIKYKVVDPNRKSFVVSGYKFFGSKYTKYYEKGYLTKAKPDTLGIFVFHQRKQAKRWVESGTSTYKILRVRPIGKGKTPTFIGQCYYPQYLDDFYNNRYPYVRDNTQIPTGTICYPAVEVLD